MTYGGLGEMFEGETCARNSFRCVDGELDGRSSVRRPKSKDAYQRQKNCSLLFPSPMQHRVWYDSWLGQNIWGIEIYLYEQTIYYNVQHYNITHSNLILFIQKYLICLR